MTIPSFVESCYYVHRDIWVRAPRIIGLIHILLQCSRHLFLVLFIASALLSVFMALLHIYLFSLCSTFRVGKGWFFFFLCRWLINAMNYKVVSIYFPFKLIGLLEIWILGKIVKNIKNYCICGIPKVSIVYTQAAL